MKCSMWPGFRGRVGAVVKLSAQVLYSLEKTTAAALEVVMGNVNVRSLPTISVG